MKKILSNYTIASYCADIADCKSGLSEIKETISSYMRVNSKVPYYFYSREKKLIEKISKLESKDIPRLTVQLRISIDKQTLYYAIKYCLVYEIAATKENIINTIKEKLIENGKSLLTEPEHWGAEVVSFKEEERVSEIFKNLSYL